MKFKTYSFQALIFVFFSIFAINAFSAQYIIEDTATVETTGNVKLSDGSEFSNIAIIGHWKDNIGSFGSNKCYGNLEKKEDITLSLETVCEKESSYGTLITRGGRKKSFQDAGVGALEIIDAKGSYLKLIGTKCRYAVSYFKKHIQYTTVCNIDDEIFEEIKIK